MDKQKVVVILLVIAIVLSAVNLFISAGFDATGFSTPNSGGDDIPPKQLEDSTGAQIGFEITGGSG
jgi:hypothetical protein